MLLLTLLLVLQAPATLADRLRSDRIEDRDLASRELLKLGTGAIAVLKPLQTDPDPEVALRAGLIIRTLTEPPPPRTRLQIEETLTRAKTVHLRFTAIPPGSESAVAGELWVKGDKFRGRFGSSLVIASDAVKVRVERQKESEEFIASEGQGRDLLLGVVRIGASRSLACRAGRATLGEIPVKGDLQPRDGLLRHFLSGRCGDQIIHDLTLTGKGLPVRRTVSIEDRLVEVETYDFGLDEDLPDETFALPGK